MESAIDFYSWMQERGDTRVENWLLMKTPVPIAVIFLLYLLLIFTGPRLMQNRQAWNLKPILIPYNFALVVLSAYMFYEFLMSSTLANYSYICQPVNYSRSELAMRMASVCWWFFFSKVIELLDTLFFILRKKNNQITFLHVYHHCTMIINWWLGVKYIAGGQSWFLAMCNSFVHIIMYSYYALAAMGPQMQKYLWWKRYMTTIQLAQFFIVIIHTTTNIITSLGPGCDYPQGFNYVVVLYAITLIILFGNFYRKSYSSKKHSRKNESNGVSNGVQDINGQIGESNGKAVYKRKGFYK